MATQNKDQFDTKPQDDIQGNPNKYSKLCEIMTQEVATQAGIDKNKFLKKSLLLIEKNPYAIRLIYEFLKSYIEARANNFNDNYTKNLMDAVWRLYNEKNREIQNGNHVGFIDNFMRGSQNIFQKIIGVYPPSWLANGIYTSGMSDDIAGIIKKIKNKKIEFQKEYPYEDEKELINAYDNFIKSKTEATLKEIINILIKKKKENTNNPIGFVITVSVDFYEAYGYSAPPLIARISEDLEEDNTNGINGDINAYTKQLLEETESYPCYTTSYQDLNKQEDEEAIKKLREIFAISEENEKEDLDNLNYNTYCCGFRKYDTSTLYNKGINTISNDILSRYTDYSPPTSCCGVLW